ncbi:MAG: gamma-glutamyl-gamma-aminobutyrate hydrolase family protein [Saccharospirillum sp.]|nr:gamma-glutamyl-gamma-aminobutyrate hydrolase family protein [Saccharospirillum sp.]
MSQAHNIPIVGVVCDVQTIAPHPFHTVGDKYLTALVQAAGVMPLLVPALTELLDVGRYLDRLDGVFLTGGYSMVHPSLYNEAPKLEQSYDQRRDALSLQLIAAAVERDLPLFAACRGFQEINVARGGTLHQALYQVEGLQEHREEKTASLVEQYAPSHLVDLVPNGKLVELLACDQIKVNSLHVQGIKQLGRGLHVEATAADGLIEAFSIEGMRFGLGVQWHPEWQIMNHPHQQRLFEAFGDACRRR